ncbi:hypothetical protein OAD22_08710 [Pseudomonadales bacterium]|nr:hypothetical protein [Pseudomonadales bacterium]MDA9298203.1 hypothetical protein [Pseudomonadales bacterium]MDB4151092.1 hypothetical protein [Pseudomonadales bacterium]MDB9868530.1 hypothetical protein [Pseudomonadales bacterium]MDB9879426.1 hypothetical protein [Pseudomonadales bacterium]
MKNYYFVNFTPTLNIAILIATVAYFWAGAHFVMAGKTIRQDLEAAQRAADAA